MKLIYDCSLRPSAQKAVTQMHPEFPGIIIVQSDGEMDEPLTELIVSSMLSSLGTKAQHVSALFFLPVTYSIPSRWAMFNAFSVSNPKAAHVPEEVQAFQDLSDSLLKHKMPTPGGIKSNTVHLGNECTSIVNILV
ncbi:MAG TPA: hypothetical protein VNW97_08960 [Candidatus Saccharimonadales bacterium]|nr:hypothetical protein [Candidatus Saccharimonadales bacterium]